MADEEIGNRGQGLRERDWRSEEMNHTIEASSSMEKR
jgi:hypothetical protein